MIKWLEDMKKAGKDYWHKNFTLMKQKIGEKIRDGKKRFKEEFRKDSK